MKEATWRIQDIWNEKLRSAQSDTKPRNYIRASEIGSPFIDRYYKMMGVQPTNPFDDRTLRIFDAGRIFEWIVEKVFKEAGILKDAQGEVVIPENTAQLKVVGHYDHKVGGNPDWEAARARIKEEGFPEWLEERSIKLTQELEKSYPKGLNEIIAEVKSINSMAFWAHKKRSESGLFGGYPHHKMQLLTYLIADEVEEGRLFYVSKDDLTLEEVPIFITPELQKLWIDDVRTMSKYYRTKTVPPKEDAIVFNEEKNKWEANWKVGRSSYLTKITGFKTKDDWEASVRSEVNRLNKELKK
jgi:CRISPR/Cas system-associated exonuclease Cas4 (RecB family)